MTEALEVLLLTRVNRDFSLARSASYAFLLNIRLRCLQGYPQVSWEDDYDVPDSLLEILSDYCRHHSLSLHCCELYLDGKAVAKSKVLGQVPYNSAGVTRFEVELRQCTLAFLLTHTKAEGLLMDESNVYNSAWSSAARTFSRNAETVEVMTDKDLLSERISVKPSELLPVSSASLADSLTDALTLVRKPVRPLLQLLHDLQQAVSSPSLAHASLSSSSAADADADATEATYSNSHENAATCSQAAADSQSGEHAAVLPGSCHAAETALAQQQSQLVRGAQPALATLHASTERSADEGIELLRMLLCLFKLAFLSRVEDTINAAAVAAQSVFWRTLQQFTFNNIQYMNRKVAPPELEGGLAESSEEVQGLCNAVAQMAVAAGRHATFSLGKFPSTQVPDDQRAQLRQCLWEVSLCWRSLWSLLMSKNKDLCQALGNAVEKAGDRVGSH